MHMNMNITQPAHCKGNGADSDTGHKPKKQIIPVWLIIVVFKLNCL